MTQECSKVPQTEWMAALRHDVERYYDDHYYGLELIWTEADWQAVRHIVENHLGVIPAGTTFSGMVIPSLDPNALYVRVVSKLKGPDGRPNRYLTCSLGLEELHAGLRDFVLNGVLNRISWALLRRIWFPINSMATDYELTRPYLGGLTRRAAFRSLMDYTLNVCMTDVIPKLVYYYWCHDIFIRFVDQLLAELVQVEHPDELKELARMKKGLYARWGGSLDV